MNAVVLLLTLCVGLTLGVVLARVWAGNQAMDVSRQADRPEGPTAHVATQVYLESLVTALETLTAQVAAVPAQAKPERVPRDTVIRYVGKHGEVEGEERVTARERRVQRLWTRPDGTQAHYLASHAVGDGSWFYHWVSDVKGGAH